MDPPQESSGFLGAKGYIHAACLYNSDAPNHFTTDETWLDINQGQYWVEAGIAYGAPLYGKYFFWADQRPGGGYHEHDDVTDIPNNTSYYYFDIFYSGSGNYDVLMGPMTGTSTGWTSPLANRISTRNETNGGASSSYGLSSELGYYTTASALHNGWYWSGGSTYPVRDPSNWGTYSMITANSWYSYGTQTTSC